MDCTAPYDDLTWVSYQFDATVTQFGRYIENKLEEVDKKGKRLHRLDVLLGKPQYDQLDLNVPDGVIDI